MPVVAVLFISTRRPECASVAPDFSTPPVAVAFEVEIELVFIFVDTQDKLHGKVDDRVRINECDDRDEFEPNPNDDPEPKSDRDEPDPIDDTRGSRSKVTPDPKWNPKPKPKSIPRSLLTSTEPTKALGSSRTERRVLEYRLLLLLLLGAREPEG